MILRLYIDEDDDIRVKYISMMLEEHQEYLIEVL